MKNLKKNATLACVAVALLTSCGTQQSKEITTLSGLNPAKFETMIDGVKPVKLYTLKNAAGMEVCVTNFG
ncbi:MAG: galactose-1-epimerase, partial [Phocaeicola sp.]